MQIPPYLNQILQLDWWKIEYKEHLNDHQGPAILLTVTTVAIAAMKGPREAFGFISMAILTYPMSHRHVVYLMYLDAHDTVVAIAVVSIQVFCMQFPHLSGWGLPLSLALAYAINLRGMRLNNSLGKQNTQIQNLDKEVQRLTLLVSSLTSNLSELKLTLTTLRDKVQKKDKLKTEQLHATQQRGETVIQIDADFKETNQLLSEINEMCKIFNDPNGAFAQLQKIGLNTQKITEQTETLEQKSRELEQINRTLEEANKKFGDLIEKATKNEEGVRQALQAFREWLNPILLSKN